MINYNNDKNIDPKFYGNDGSEKKNVIRILVIVLIVGAIAYGFGLWKENQRGPALPGEVILKGDMDIAEADKLLQEAGYIPEDEVKTNDRYYKLYYKSSEVFGYTTVRSALAVDKTGSQGMYFIHCFEDDSEENNADNPGEKFKAIYTILTKQIDEYPKMVSSSDKAWTWSLNRKTKVHMLYTSDGVFVVEYHYLNK